MNAKSDQISVTFDPGFGNCSVSFLDKKIADNLKATGLILMQFLTVMCRNWFS